MKLIIPTRPRFFLPALAAMILSTGIAAAADAPKEKVPALTNSLLSNPGFEEVYTKDGAFVPNGWGFQRWDNNDTIVGTVEETPGATGKMAVKLPACGKGGIGFSSASQPLSGDFGYLSVNLRVKKSADFTANPWVVLAWFKGSTFIGTTDLKTDVKSGEWDRISQKIPREEIPEGADHFCLNIAELGKEGATGTIWYDDAIVTTGSHLQLKPSAEFGWFEEEPVKFVAPDAPPEVQSLRGTVYDSTGGKVAEITVKHDDLLRDGWVWKASSPGFYEIAFESLDDQGAATPMTRNWVQRSYGGQGTGKTATLTKDRYSVVVAKKGIWKERPLQFGIDNPGVYKDKEGKQIHLAAQLGFGFIRKWLYWGDDWSGKSSLSSAPGVYEWDAPDRYMALARQYGFHNNIATIWGTAKWASPHPELTDLDICVKKYSEYPPTNLKDFGDFMTALVKRYDSYFKEWEIWNEQNLPTATVFWKGTPVEYTALLKTAYEAVKKEQPDSIVWIGGMAPRRYDAFYKEFLKTDGYPYFDMYSAHGSFPEIEIPRRDEVAAGVKSKPWSSSEWHAIILETGEPIPSETALGHRMMTDLFQQLKNGAKRISLFTMLNDNQENEGFPFLLSIGERGQTYGLFRRNPSIEPRFSALVMHDFLTRLEGDKKIEFVKQYDLGDQKGVLFNNGGKPLLVVWNEGTHPMPLDPQLAKGVTSLKSATTWEGKAWTNGLIDTTAMVYFPEVDRTVLEAIKAPATALLYPWQKKKTVSTFANVCKGPLSSAPLFGSVTEEINPQVSWIGENLVFQGINGQQQPADFSARFAVGAATNGLDLVVDVHDPVFFQNSKPGEYYNGDSIQFAIDAAGSGQQTDVTEISVALTTNGPVVWKESAAYIGGDLPGGYTPEKQPVKYARAEIEKTPGGLLYKVHLDWSELYPLSFDPNKPLRFSLLVNDNDGKGRLGWLEWSGGIGAAKDPTQFGKLLLGSTSEAASPNLFGKEALTKASGMWNPWLSPADKNAKGEYLKGSENASASIKLTLPDEDSNGGMVSASIPVSAGATYHLSASVRGEGNLGSHWIQYDGQNKELTNDMKAITGSGLILSDNWQMLDRSLLIPEDVTSSTFNFHLYKQSGWFEVTDLRLEKE